jgi:hypothetical protein
MKYVEKLLVCIVCTHVLCPAANGASLPGFAFGSAPDKSQQPQPPAYQVTAEEQEMITEAQHQVALSKGAPTAGLFPRTRLNPNRTVKPGPRPTGF